MLDFNPIKRFFQNHILIFSAVCLILGLFLTIISLCYAFLDENSTLGDFAKNKVGNFAIWFAILGLILLLAGLFYFIATIFNKRKFEKLIDTHSKAKFIRKLDEIDKLAWKLTNKERQKVVLKKRKFRI